MTLIVINTQGASDETRGLESIDAIRDQIATWADLENLTARVWDNEGKLLYEGPAADFGCEAASRVPPC